MQLSCLFVNYNSWGVLANALDSLRAHPPTDAGGSAIPYEIVVVDNASQQIDATARQRVADEVRRVGGRVLEHDANGGYAAGVELAAAHARGRLLLVANPDVLFGAEAVTRLMRHFDAHRDIGIAAPAVFADRACHVEMPIPFLPTVGDLLRTALGTVSIKCNRRYAARRTRAALRTWGTEAPLDQPTFGGCCFLTSRAVVDRIGLLDARYPLYYEDTDLARRVRRAGLRIVRVGSARIVHLYDRSAATDRPTAMARHDESRRRYFARWHGLTGRAALAATTWLLQSRWGRARATVVAARFMHAVEFAGGRPVVVLPRRCRRFLIEVAFEPYLFLAAGTFGTGDRWSPDDEALAQLRRDAWIRAVDLDGPEPVELGLWRCPAVADASPAPAAPPAAASAPAVAALAPAAYPAAVPPFNRIADRIADDLQQPENRAITAAVDELSARYAAMDRPLRRDVGRAWEYAHVLAEFERLVRASAAPRRIEHVLDLGGGNSPIAYLLVERGFRVHVVDIDPAVVEAVRRNSRELQWGERLTAAGSDDGRIPMFDDAYDCALCISVVEGVLRKDRARMFAEIRRTLRPGGSLLLTFDYGDEARLVGDPPVSIAEVERDLVAASGLELVGELPAPPQFGAAGPPVRNEVPTLDGRGTRAITYTFGALHLRRRG